MLSFAKKEKNKRNIIAHRGASAFEHENSILAFEKAISLKADAIEFDVRKTKDNVLVVHHDVRLFQSATPLSKMNYEEFEHFNSKSYYQVPTLEEVLKLCQDKIALDIELKETGYENKVVELALKYFNKENVLFTSFRKKALQAIHTIDDSLFTGYLFHKPMRLHTIPKDVDYLLPHYSLNRFGYFKKLSQFEKPLIVWTVDKNKIKYEKDYIFALITNDPT